MTEFLQKGGIWIQRQTHTEGRGCEDMGRTPSMRQVHLRLPEAGRKIEQILSYSLLKKPADDTLILNIQPPEPRGNTSLFFELPTSWTFVKEVLEM